MHGSSSNIILTLFDSMHTFWSILFLTPHARSGLSRLPQTCHITQGLGLKKVLKKKNGEQDTRKFLASQRAVQHAL